MSTSQLVDPITSLLPPELTTKIFQLCIQELVQTSLEDELSTLMSFDLCHRHDNITTEGPVLLCQVSRTWRDFVYDCPMLWTNICAHTSSALGNQHAYSEWLARSGKLPLAVCISLDLPDHIDAFTVIFNHSARIRSLRFLDTTGEDVTWDLTSSPFTSLDTFAIESVQPIKVLPMISAIIATAPHLRSIKWNLDHVPIPLHTIGSQLKELNFSTRVSDDRTYNALRACPNVVKLLVRYRSYTEPIGGGDVLLADLQVLDSYRFAMQGVVAPKLRKFTFQGFSDYIPDLMSFIRQSPQLDDLDLNLLNAADDLIEMIPHLSTVTRLKIAVETVFSVLYIDKIFKTLTWHQEDGAASCLLPNLRHLYLHFNLFNVKPFDVNGEPLMNMLESRCRPYAPTAASGGVVISRLESFTFGGDGTITQETRQRLRSLQLQAQAPRLSLLHIDF
ncbi:hypothetical protein BJ138DRAFT_1152069 [Hygrophoropsis aurantiaca]|uniref:Uncharacterized protein n=1 Tax=Hygrophoropsis aurantiaca TaxID=72124 RepID=A0ACB8ADM9_9AGAM|nr:hypothetical protein BJ138DRAFT_1152069 [Hygrophoropsis aurantiaca]